MKRTTIIGIAFATYVVAMIGMFFGVEKYIAIVFTVLTVGQDG